MIFNEERVFTMEVNEVLSCYDCSKLRLISLSKLPFEKWTRDDMVNAHFDCSQNLLQNLEGCPNKLKSLNFSKNKLTSLQGIHKIFKGGYIKETINLTGNPITHSILGLMLIPELHRIDELWVLTGDLFRAADIVNHHLVNELDIIDCQQLLIDAGLKAYAQL